MGFRAGIQIEADGLHHDRATEPDAARLLSIVVGTA
jgi:very-short-patch-repair endonuclease